MPWGDGTGPWWGQGMLGCFRGRRGFGRGFGRAGWQQFPKDEASELKEYAAELKEELKAVEKRLKELGNK